jgi:hypothetical protein
VKLSDLKWEPHPLRPKEDQLSQVLFKKGWGPHGCRVHQTGGVYHVITWRSTPVAVRWSRSPSKRPPRDMDELDLLCFLVDCEPYPAEVTAG